MSESSSEKVLGSAPGGGKEDQTMKSEVSSVVVGQDQIDLKVDDLEEAHQRGQDVYPLDEDPPSVGTPLVEPGDLLHLDAKPTEPATAPAPLENGQPDDGLSNVTHENQVAGENSELIGQSDDQSQSGDTASYSIPSLDFSEGNNGVSVDEPPSSSYSALGADTGSLGVEAACLAEEALPPGPSGAAAAATTATAGGVSTETEAPTMPAYYFVKWITWKEKKTPIITQSENGPCPLLAIMNILFLRWKVSSRFSYYTTPRSIVRPVAKQCGLYESLSMGPDKITYQFNIISMSASVIYADC